MCAYLKLLRPERRHGARMGVVVLLLFLATPVFAADAARESSAVAPGAEESRIPFKRSEEATGGLVLRIFGGLIVTLAVGVGALYMIKRYLPTVYGQLSTTGSGTRIQVLEVRRLTPKTTLFLVEVDGARLLLGQSGETLITLSTSPIDSVAKTNDG